MEKLHQYFDNNDIQVISTIPLCEMAFTDGIIWNFTPLGQFMLSSAYRLTMNSKAIQHGIFNPSISEGRHDNIWKTIWSFQTLSWVKLNMWRWIKRALSTKEALWHRHILRDPKELSCAWCKMHLEIDMYIPFHCLKEKKIWREANIDLSWATTAATSPLQMWESIVNAQYRQGDLILSKVATL